MANRLSFCLILTLVAVTVHATRLKLKLADVREDATFYEKYRSLYEKRQATTACDDRVEISRESLTLPSERLNNLDVRVKFYRSETARVGLEMLNARLVPGLGGQTVGDVFQVFRNRQCLPLLYGGSVRDQFLGATPNDVDVEVDCAIDDAKSICQTTWGETNCKFTQASGIGHIGSGEDPDDNIDYATTDVTFYADDSLSMLEYTVNSLAYDTNGNNVIIDIPGSGVDDVCNRHIRIPSDDNSEASWDSWRETGDDKRLYRFWKLREKDLRPYNQATLEYIVRYSKMGIDSTPRTFGKFYCSAAYGGSILDTTENVCTVSQRECGTATLGKAYKYNTVLAEDFSDYWSDVIVPNVLPSNNCGKRLSKHFVYVVSLSVHTLHEIDL